MKKSLIAGLAIAASLIGVSSASARDWAPAATATIHPGVQLFTDGAQCTANFVYTDAAGAVYIGQAAHCSGTGGQTDTDGGSTGMDTNGTAAGDTVFTYGNSELRAGVTLLSPKRGLSLGDDGNGWSHNVTTVSPGIPGDSGSGFMDDSGKALGILSTLQIAPVAVSNGVGDLPKELDYMHSHGGPSATLAQGTEAFTGSIIG